MCQQNVVRKFMAPILILSMFLMWASPANAGSNSPNTHQTVRETVTWTLTPAQCSLLQSTVTGVGERHMEINTQVKADGSTQKIVNDLVTGDATDSSGTYKFVYQNHSVETVPPGGGPHEVSMEDSFILNGKGSAGHINVGFVWRYTYTPGSPDDTWPPTNLQRVVTRGDLGCDPL